MAVGVFPQRMDRVNPEDPAGAIRTMEDYIRYMTERVEFSVTNHARNLRKQGVGMEEIAAAVAEQGDRVAAMTSQLLSISEQLGTVSTSLASLIETVRVLGLRVEALEAQNPHGPYILAQPVSAEAAIGETVVFTVEAAGEGLTYQWYFRSGPSGTWTASSTGTTARYAWTMQANRDGRQVYCTVTDSGGLTVDSDVATATLKEGE